MSGRAALQPALAKLVAFAAVVAVVWILGFAAAIALAIFLVIAPVRTQVEEIQRNLPAYTDQAKRQADSLQGFFERRGIDVDVKERGGLGVEPAVPGAAPVAVTEPARERPTRAMDSPELGPGP